MAVPQLKPLTSLQLSAVNFTAVNHRSSFSTSTFRTQLCRLNALHFPCIWQEQSQRTATCHVTVLFSLALVEEMIRTTTIPWTRRLRKGKCQWPSPELSIGMFYRKMGSSSCWEAVGAARQIFVRIADEIRVYLNKYSDEVPHQVTWTMYMIGKTKDTAEPMIMFCCRDTNCRKQVRKTIEQSGILEKYPGVRVGDAVRPPDFDQLVQLAGTSSHEDSNPFTSFGGGDRKQYRSISALDSDFATKATNGVTIYGQKDRLGAGCPIVIVTKNRSSTTSSTILRATAGGIVVADNRFFYLTAGHAFDTTADRVPETEDSNDQDNYEFDIGEESDSEEDSKFVEATSRGSLSPDLVEYDGSDDSSSTIQLSDTQMPATCDEKERETQTLTDRAGSMHLGKDSAETASRLQESRTVASKPKLPLSMDDHVVIGDLLEATGYQPHLDLDYALIELRPGFQNINCITRKLGQHETTIRPGKIVMGAPREAKVLAVIGSAGILEGTLSGTTSYRNQPGSTKFQEIWTVRLVGQLTEGDCGSWVVDSITGDLFGHIIAGSPKSGVAYVLPAQQIFDDAPNRYGLQFQLPITWQDGLGYASHETLELGLGNVFNTTKLWPTSTQEESTPKLKGKEREVGEVPSPKITVAGQLRVWKCPVESCKYNEYGWPTEKERDRHHNDVHSSAPIMYTCMFKPCPYKSKRESNCKQHMEKAHGWEYVRSTRREKRGKLPAMRFSQHQSSIINMLTPPDDMDTNSDAKLGSRDYPLFSTSEVPTIVLTPPDLPSLYEDEPMEFLPMETNNHAALFKPQNSGSLGNARSVFSDDSGISGMSSASNAHIPMYGSRSDKSQFPTYSFGAENSWDGPYPDPFSFRAMESTSLNLTPNSNQEARKNDFIALTKSFEPLDEGFEDGAFASKFPNFNFFSSGLDLYTTELNEDVGFRDPPPEGFFPGIETNEQPMGDQDQKMLDTYGAPDYAEARDPRRPD
ncbi:hypothetical protein BKA65DRAFT_144371 [Rhexocercosporidium sp. MPI-PUGE-AT-0058]|nr:hypothetical protein BKA65DRAFT_144371 [Rhexocercosporidium sp. MPI-PUGE-AT-0058]